MIGDKADEVIKKNFKSILSRYQIDLETTMKNSNILFDCVDLSQKCQKNLDCDCSYIDSPDWI